MRRRQQRRPFRGCRRRQCMHLQTPLSHQRLQASAVEEAYDGGRAQVEAFCIVKFCRSQRP